MRIDRGAAGRVNSAGGGGELLRGRHVSELPVVRQELIQLARRVVADPGDHVAQVGEHVQAVPVGAGDQAVEHRGGLSPVVAAGEQPVLSSRAPDERLTRGQIDCCHGQLEISVPTCCVFDARSHIRVLRTHGRVHGSFPLGVLG